MSLLSDLLQRELPPDWWTTPVGGRSPRELVADYESGKCGTSYQELIDRLVATSKTPGQCACGHLQHKHRHEWNGFRGVWDTGCDTCLQCGQGRTSRSHGHDETWCPCTKYQEAT